MTWKTHKNGAFTATLLCMPLIIQQLSQSTNSMEDLTALVLICFILVYNSALYGTAFVDLDHGNINSIPLKNLFTKSISRFMHFIFKGKLKMVHRSWQTHSIDLYLIFVGVPYLRLMRSFSNTGDVITYLLGTILIAFMVGGILHCVMDLFTTDGAWVSVVLAWVLTCVTGKKLKDYRVSLAPTWLWYPKLEIRYLGGTVPFPAFYKFYPCPTARTGSDYEDGFRELIVDLNRILGIVIVLLYTKSLWIPIVTPLLELIRN